MCFLCCEAPQCWVPQGNCLPVITWHLPSPLSYIPIQNACLSVFPVPLFSCYWLLTRTRKEHLVSLFLHSLSLPLFYLLSPPFLHWNPSLTQVLVIFKASRGLCHSCRGSGWSWALESRCSFKSERVRTIHSIVHLVGHSKLRLLFLFLRV